MLRENFIRIHIYIAVDSFVLLSAITESISYSNESNDYVGQAAKVRHL